MATELFARKCDQMNRFLAMTNGSQVAYTGADNYAFPILAEDRSSKWYFDGDAGTKNCEHGSSEAMNSPPWTPAVWSRTPRNITTTPEGFTIFSSPVSYQRSGIMSFSLGRDGVIYQQDLGLEMQLH